MKAGNYCKHDVATVYGHASVERAALIMRERHVGDLVVVVGEGTRLVPVGMITDRDVAIEVVAQGLKPGQTQVSTVMTTSVVTVNVDDELTSVLRTMSDQGVRRAPVVDDHGVLRGVISIDDLIGAITGELARVTRLIRRGRELEFRKTDEAYGGELAT